MSLSVLAARIAVVEALKGRTLAGDNVLDSEIAALDADSDGNLRVGQEKRFVAVYTQGGKISGNSNEPRPFFEGGTCEILFEAGVTAAMGARDPDTGVAFVFEGIPVTDAAFEFYLNVLGRQIFDCLNDPDNAWADIWRALCPTVMSIEGARAAGMEQTRLAGHQIKLTCEVIDQPIAGHALDPEGGFSRFMLALEAHADAERRAMAVELRALIAGGLVDGWTQTADRMGLSPREADSLGITPLATADESVGTTADVTIDVEGLGQTVVTEAE